MLLAHTERSFTCVLDEIDENSAQPSSSIVLIQIETSLLYSRRHVGSHVRDDQVLRRRFDLLCHMTKNGRSETRFERPGRFYSRSITTKDEITLGSRPLVFGIARRGLTHIDLQDGV